MKYSEQQLKDLVDLFHSQELPKAEWTHHSHILVAFWHVSRYGENDALIKVRHAIRQYNTAVGTLNSDTSGYHETLTVFWLKVVRHYYSLRTYDSLVDAVNSFIMAGNAEKTLVLQFYSHELLFSTKARQQWVEPDKISLINLSGMIRQPNSLLSHLKVEKP